MEFALRGYADFAPRMCLVARGVGVDFKACRSRGSRPSSPAGARNGRTRRLPPWHPHAGRRLILGKCLLPSKLPRALFRSSSVGTASSRWDTYTSSRGVAPPAGTVPRGRCPDRCVTLTTLQSEPGCFGPCYPTHCMQNLLGGVFAAMRGHLGANVVAYQAKGVVHVEVHLTVRPIPTFYATAPLFSLPLPITVSIKSTKQHAAWRSALRSAHIWMVFVFPLQALQAICRHHR